MPGKHQHFQEPGVGCCGKYFLFGFNIVFWVSAGWVSGPAPGVTGGGPVSYRGETTPCPRAEDALPTPSCRPTPGTGGGSCGEARLQGAVPASAAGCGDRESSRLGEKGRDTRGPSVPSSCPAHFDTLGCGAHAEPQPWFREESAEKGRVSFPAPLLPLPAPGLAPRLQLWPSGPGQSLHPSPSLGGFPGKGQ